jgi:hypothetical protein
MERGGIDRLNYHQSEFGIFIGSSPGLISGKPFFSGSIIRLGENQDERVVNNLK